MHLNLKRPKIFYGWWIVGASLLIALSMSGVVYYGFTVIFNPVVEEFGWSYAQVSLAASLRGMEAALLAPLMGILVDRWGARKLLISGSVISALGLVLLGRANSLGMFYAAFFLLAVGFSGCGWTVMMTTVASWFRRRVSLASAIAGSGFGLGALLIPLIVMLIDSYGWRISVIILGLGMPVIVLPLSLLIRPAPGQYGYLSGKNAQGAMTHDNVPDDQYAIEIDITVKKALKSRSFWHITIMSICVTLGIHSVMTHVMPFLSSIGVARSVAGQVAVGLAIMGTTGRVIFGWLGDKIDARWVTAGACAFVVLGLLFFEYAANMRSLLLVVPFIILFGAGYAAVISLRTPLMIDSFGRKKFGPLLGFMAGITSLVSMAGPPLTGWVFDNWGSYQGIWFVLAGVALLAMVSVLTAPPRVNATK